jgi:hypothetical protein
VLCQPNKCCGTRVLLNGQHKAVSISDRRSKTTLRIYLIMSHEGYYSVTSCTNCIPGNYYKLVHTSILHTGTVLLRISAAKVSSAFLAGWRCSEGTSDKPRAGAATSQGTAASCRAKHPLPTSPLSLPTATQLPAPKYLGHPRAVSKQVPLVKRKRCNTQSSTAKQPTTCANHRTHDACKGPACR